MIGINVPLRFWLGRTVAVVIDRPLGSRHPHRTNLVYPVNYGHIPNTEAGDRAPLDAYVLGIATPIDSFIGEVIAIVIRRDDIEGKLIVAPAGQRFTHAQLVAAVAFQEQYFDSVVVLSEHGEP